jgi:glutaconate CoA-transferase subunit A
MGEAAELVSDGDMLALGGYTLYRKPMAFVRELAKGQYENLTVLSFAGSIDCDLLIGSGLVCTIRSCYVGMEYLGLAPNYRRFVESGKVKVIEESELTIGTGLKAALQRVPSVTVKQLFETEILKVRPDIKETICPLTGEKLVALPAIKPDVAVIHVLQSDPYGNAYFKGNLCVDKELAMVSDKVILTAENIVATEELLRGKPEGVQICNFEVDAVVPAFGGAHPTSCYPYYTFDVWHLLSYIESARNDESFRQYLEKYVFTCKNLEEYLERTGGINAMRRILL